MGILVFLYASDEERAFSVNDPAYSAPLSEYAFFIGASIHIYERSSMYPGSIKFYVYFNMRHLCLYT
jgi:hypothetical protein